MYRLYIDETGNADMRASQDPNHRFLSLTGIVMDIDHARDTAYPQLERLKADIFNSHPDEPIILHRKELVQKARPFQALRDATKCAEFDTRFYGLLDTLSYRVITVVIDKLEHLNRYVVWRYDPYHYCLEVLLERYVMWLDKNHYQGDVLGEVRGGKPDRRLEACYARIYHNGTDFVRAPVFQRCLTTEDLKLKPKSQNVTGLQLADAIAHPSAQYVRHLRGHAPFPNGFGGKVATLLKGTKYFKRYDGVHEGWGFKWLP